MLCIVICEDDGKDLAYIKRIVDEYCAVHVKHSRRLKGGAFRRTRKAVFAGMFPAPHRGGKEI